MTSPVIELRQYITYPGKRDVLRKLFEDRFIESQEAAGIQVIGQFEDRNDPNHFTWMRGFANMEARHQALSDFYYGELWKTHRDEANATLYDNDDVLLLRPALAGAGFALDPSARPPIGSTAPRDGLVIATIYHFDGTVGQAFIDRFEQAWKPLFERHGARILGRFVSEKSRNTFERLPVREDTNVYAWFARFAGQAAYHAWLDSLARDPRWSGDLFAALYQALQRQPEVLQLTPTPRSLLT